MSNSFFSRDNIHTAVWALLLALFGFAVGLIWTHYTGPQKVILQRGGNNTAIDTTITIVRFEGDSATLQAIRDYEPRLAINSRKETTKNKIASVARPQLRMPDIVQGWLKKSINSFASVDLPRQTFTNNELIEIQLNIFDETTLKRISPVFIEIVKQGSTNTRTSIWLEQFRIQHTRTSIRFSSDFAKGEYLLTIGFYFMDELHQKFPPQYVRTSTITII